MSESERTKRMKYFLKQKFNRNDSDYKLQLQEEVSCGEYHRNRCDLAGIEYVNGEIHNSIGIEIKQQLGDFKSGYGMNFCFDVRKSLVKPWDVARVYSRDVKGDFRLKKRL